MIFFTKKKDSQYTLKYCDKKNKFLETKTEKNDFILDNISTIKISQNLIFGCGGIEQDS